MNMCIANNLDCSKAMTKLIISYLSRRKLRVKVEHEIFIEKEIKAGALQGPVLTPRLLSIYTSHIP